MRTKITFQAVVSAYNLIHNTKSLAEQYIGRKQCGQKKGESTELLLQALIIA